MTLPETKSHDGWLGMMYLGRVTRIEA